MAKTQKETIEFDAQFLTQWNNWCDQKGFVKRQAAHACRIAFMKLTAEQRESMMHDAMKIVIKARQGR